MKSVLQLLLILAFSLKVSAQNLHFRTDGYYFYDNKCDTLFLMDTKDKKNDQWIKMITRSGLVVDDSVSCAPKGSIPLNGGSRIKMLAFFSDKKGSYFNNACWDNTVRQTALSKVGKLRKEGSLKDRKGEFFTVPSFEKDNTFVLQEQGCNVNTQKVLTGRLYKNQLVITEHYLIPGFEKDNIMVFNFYTYDQMPPTRKKMIFAYRDPAKWQHK